MSQAHAQKATSFQAMFCCRLAEVRCKAGARTEAEACFAAAEDALEHAQAACPNTLALMTVELGCVAGGIALLKDDVQKALVSYQQASQTLAKESIDGELGWAVVRLFVHARLGEAECQLLLGQEQKAAELARDAQQSLEQFSEGSWEHPLQKAAVVLFSAEQAVSAVLECEGAADMEVWGLLRQSDYRAKPKAGRGRGRGKAAQDSQQAPALEEQLPLLLWALEVSQHSPMLLR